MNEERDPLIAAAFAAASDEMPARDFTAEVMSRIERQRKRTMIAWVAAAFLSLPVFWFLASPLQGAVAVLGQVLPSSIVQVNEGFVAQLLSPLNSFAGLAGMVFVAGHTLYRKIFS